MLAMRLSREYGIALSGLHGKLAVNADLGLCARYGLPYGEK